MGYKLWIIDFHLHFHVSHTYYDYLKEFLSSFSSLFASTLTPNITLILLNCKPMIINIINISIEVTQKNAHLNFQDRKHIGNNCFVNNLVVFSSLSNKELDQTSLINKKFYS